jgi:hypothetical protein
VCRARRWYSLSCCCVLFIVRVLWWNAETGTVTQQRRRLVSHAAKRRRRRIKKKPSALRNWILLTHRSPSIVSVSALGTSEETHISSCWHPLSFIYAKRIQNLTRRTLFCWETNSTGEKKTIESASVGWWFGSCERHCCAYLFESILTWGVVSGGIMLYNVAYCSNYSPVNYHHQQQVCRSKSFLTCLYCCYTRIVSIFIITRATINNKSLSVLIIMSDYLYTIISE